MGWGKIAIRKFRQRGKSRLTFEQFVFAELRLVVEGRTNFELHGLREVGWSFGFSTGLREVGWSFGFSVRLYRKVTGTLTFIVRLYRDVN